jgi:hypothetical protein
MSITLERVPLAPKKAKSTADFRSFCLALRDMEIGESFVHNMSSNLRVTISAVQIMMNKSFTAQKEPGTDKFRIGRVA